MRASLTSTRLGFASRLNHKRFVTDKTGVKTIEIIGSCFLANEPMIFGEPSSDYISREIEWYKSMSLNVNDIPGGPPEIWKQVATKQGFINSNYGWVIWSGENYDQYYEVYEELKKNPFSRRAVMIYTRPSMWVDYNRAGMSDFMCTNTVQYLIRDGKLDAVVQMRSNDAIFGYKNDRAWQVFVLDMLAKELEVEPGDIHWNVGSLHIYERHFYLVDNYYKSIYQDDDGPVEFSISKEEYVNRYPDSEWGWWGQPKPKD